MQLGKTYSPREIENSWYQFWETNNYFKPNMSDAAPNYCIQLPPPNVTGTLHMGHAFQQTIMDMLIRYHRMRGYNTLWQPGTDHAGIATQIVVERQLEQQKITRQELGREEFINKVWQWKEYSGNTITSQMRRLGASCDWSRERFTMDEGLSVAVSKVFVELYNQGYIYRGKRLVNWDVQLQSAVSDLEVLSVEEQGSLWYIRYPIENSDESIVVATTRPETMLGDVAVCVNPEDERYLHLIGKYALLPLVNRRIKIIADDYVSPEFGTGCVKITPAHDFNDYAIGKRHNLELINILNLDGTLNDNCPVEYRAMERFAARKKIIEELDKLNLLVETKPHKLMVPRGERTNVVIEPILTNQWFVAMDKFAARGLELVDSGQINFVPELWKKTYDQWLDNIQDWCISRQLWWGHQIPAYYDKAGQIFVAQTRLEAEQLANSTDLVQDNDVLDTWFSSALWPFSTLDWPNENQFLDKFLPSNVLVTGFDIIFFWVARMIMLTDKFTGKIPFKDIYINGLIMDAHGNKMSKSKGNVIDPIDLIDGIELEQLVTKRTANLMNPKTLDVVTRQTRRDYPDGFMAFGADSLRFSLASLASQARYINFDLKRMESSRNFCNKLFNASKFVLMNVQNNVQLCGQPYTPTLIDQWICNKLARLIDDVDQGYATYRFDLLSQKIYEFIWNEFCDWYLELAKVNLQSDDLNSKTATINTLLIVLEALLRIVHPIMPFITEEIWQVIAPISNKQSTASIMIASYPKSTDYSIEHSEDIHTKIDDLKEIITTIRNLRAEMNVPLATKVPLMIETSRSEIFTETTGYIKSLAKISQVEFTDNLNATNAPIAISKMGKLMLVVEIDVTAEKLRLEREITKVQLELDKISEKLANPNYAARAPQDLVARDQSRVNELQLNIKKLTEQLNQL